jgi:hypothetical protein
MLALALAGAAITAAGARALGQSSHEADSAPEGAPEVTIAVAPEATPEVTIDAVITPVMTAQGGPTWQPLSALTRDARAALAGSAADARTAIDAALHGDPSMGCFVLALRLGSGSVAMHDALREALSQPGQDAAWPALNVRDWTTTTLSAPADATAAAPASPAGARSTFAFTSEGLQGEVRVLSRGLQPPADTVAVACFFDAREPARAARLCQRMLPALEAALSTIPAPRPATIPETSP